MRTCPIYNYTVWINSAAPDKVENASETVNVFPLIPQDALLINCESTVILLQVSLPDNVYYDGKTNLIVAVEPTA